MTIPATEAKSKPRWERRKDARPQELLAAALDLFVERGYAGTRLDDVASLAGVSKGTLYLYFENKEELFKAVVRENIVKALMDAEDLIAGFDGHSSALLRRLVLNWWNRIGQTKLSGISKLIMAESSNFPDVARFYHEEVVSRGEALLVSILERGIARGEYRNVDVEHAKLVIIAPVMMLMLWKHSFTNCRTGPIDSQAYLDCLLDLLARGLESGAPAAIAGATASPSPAGPAGSVDPAAPTAPTAPTH